MAHPKIQTIASLLEKAGHAHHDAFKNVDGADPEWALWYARYLEKPLSELLGTELSQPTLVSELVRMAESLDTDKEPWPKVYAADLLSRHGGKNG